MPQAKRATPPRTIEDLALDEPMARPPYNPRDAALQTAETGRKIAACVWDAIAAEKPEDADILAVYAVRLERCNSNGNLWTAEDMHTDDGEAFDGNGRFWFCGSKLCSYCLKKQSNRSRKLLRQAIAEQRVDPSNPASPVGLPVGENYNFLTLTMPNLGVPILAAREILNDAWALFRKRQWFLKTIVGGGKSEEFTQTKRGTHYHCHALVRSRYINYSTFRHIWTECLESAFRNNGYVFSAATTDGMAIANSRRVGSIEEAIKEVAKYLTKCTSWAQVGTDQLLDLCRIERWPRMFELFGSFRSSQPVAVSEGDTDDGSIKTILDTKQISDGDPETGWRTEVDRLGVAKYLEKLEQSSNDQCLVRMQQLRRRYDVARFKRIRDEMPMDIERIVTRIKRVYTLSGRPPPPTLRRNLNLDERLELNTQFGLGLNADNRHAI